MKQPHGSPAEQPAGTAGDAKFEQIDVHYLSPSEHRLRPECIWLDGVPAAGFAHGAAPSCIGSHVLRAFQLAETDLDIGYFHQHEGVMLLCLSSALGFYATLDGETRERLSANVGDEQGLFGLVAATGRALYLPECSQDPRWVPVSPHQRSAYLVPVNLEEKRRDVLVICARTQAAFGPELLALIDGMVRRAVEFVRLQSDLSTRVRRLERALQRVAMDIEEVGIATGGRDLPIRREALADVRNLSEREWRVLRALLANRRTSAIARELSISPHTVRNHLKSIFRKVGVHSQAELIELLMNPVRE